MATVTYNGVSYTCTTAIKGSDYIRLLNSNNTIDVSFDGVTDFSAFSISDGSWTTPTDDDDCYIAVIRDDGTIGKGNKKCCDVSPADHTHSLSSLGAAASDHTHTPASIGAAAASHTHTPASIGAAATSHTHKPADIGAAAADHTHTPASIGAAALNSENKVTASQASADVSSFTASFTLGSSHCGKFLYANSTSAITITVPDSDTIPVDTEIEILRFGAGSVTITGANTLYFYGIGATAGVGTKSYKITDRYGVAALKKIAGTTWIISGAVEIV